MKRLRRGRRGRCASVPPSGPTGPDSGRSRTPTRRTAPGVRSRSPADPDPPKPAPGGHVRPGPASPRSPTRPHGPHAPHRTRIPLPEAGSEAQNGALGGSFRPAPGIGLTRTAESRGSRRTHPTCQRERSSQGAKPPPKTHQDRLRDLRRGQRARKARVGTSGCPRDTHRGPARRGTGGPRTTSPGPAGPARYSASTSLNPRERLLEVRARGLSDVLEQRSRTPHPRARTATRRRRLPRTFTGARPRRAHGE